MFELSIPGIPPADWCVKLSRVMPRQNVADARAQHIAQHSSQFESCTHWRVRISCLVVGLVSTIAAAHGEYATVHLIVYINFAMNTFYYLNINREFWCIV